MSRNDKHEQSANNTTLAAQECLRQSAQVPGLKSNIKMHSHSLASCHTQGVLELFHSLAMFSLSAGGSLFFFNHYEVQLISAPPPDEWGREGGVFVDPG